METSKFIKHSLLPILQTFSTYLLGSLIVTFFTLFFTLTFPVYIIRFIVIQLAKTFRPDLGQILSDKTAYLASDFLKDKPQQRANNVLTLVINDKVSFEEFKEDFVREWITHPKIPSYEKFTQYPVHWLGFTFWKKARDTFKIENHISLLSPKDKIFTQQDLENAVTKLLNSRFSLKQSPWKLFLVENYKLENNSLANEKNSLVIFKWHHSLADGYSVLVALMHGFVKDFTVDQIELPKMQFPKRTLINKLLFAITFPARAYLEMCYLLGHTFLKSPLKISDHKKNWHQVCVRSKPISVADVKAIKNCAGVSYTSVLLSAMSAALDKSLNRTTNNLDVKSALCGSALPMPEPMKNPGLRNYVTTAVFNLNVGPFANSIERLQSTHKTLQDNRDSVVPLLFNLYAFFIGNHFHFVYDMFYNRSVGAGLTNFAGVPTRFGKDGRTITQCYTVAGALPGELGLAVTAVSQGEQVYMQMCVERALMSKEEAQDFLKLISEEIKYLLKVVVHNNVQYYETSGKKTR